MTTFNVSKDSCKIAWDYSPTPGSKVLGFKATLRVMDSTGKAVAVNQASSNNPADREMVLTKLVPGTTDVYLQAIGTGQESPASNQIRIVYALPGTNPGPAVPPTPELIPLATPTNLRVV